MILDTERFGFTREIERHFPIIRRELDNLAPEEFIIWPAVGAYSGAWRVFPFIEHCSPEDFHCDLEANCARCPETARFLHTLPRVRGASFSRLDPGSTIRTHADLPVPGILRTHLALKIPEDAELILAGVPHRWTEGKLLCFDGQIEHSTINTSSQPRDVLIIDMILNEEELAYVQIA